MISIVNRILQTDEELIHKLMNSNFSEEIANAAKEICDVFRKNGKVMIIGNGGSAADAQHFAAELVGRFQYNRRPLPAIALNADSAVLTSMQQRSLTSTLENLLLLEMSCAIYAFAHTNQ